MPQTDTSAKPTDSIGKPLDRVDGRLKVTGGAKYSAEMPVADALHGVLVTSTIAKGSIATMETKSAEAVPGVKVVLTPFNAPQLNQPTSPGGAAARPQDRRLALLQNQTVRFNNQPIAVVVADTLEQARYAASLIRVTYLEEKPVLDLHKGDHYKPKMVQQEETDKVKGDLKSGRDQAKSFVEQTYTTPMENHNPMEPHSTIAVWESPDHLTVYDATQGIFGVKGVLAKTFNLPPANVRCVTYFVGGGFGCKGSAWSHVPLTAMAAKVVGRPVKLVLTRSQMFGMVGYRPVTEHKMALGSDTEGHLTLTKHNMLSNTSTFDEFVEASATVTRMLYNCPNIETTHRLSRIDAGTPTFMRGPGESTGTWALESMMDELAYSAKIDPLALRLQNYAETDPGNDKPFSTKSLRECYRVGAERFGWDKRNPAVRSTRAPDGRLLGIGMATATYPARRSPASALARILPDGTGYCEAGSQDIGTGTYTIMTQIAADGLGLPPERVRFELGDTKMPETPVSGGSQTAASTGSAVQQTCEAVKKAAIIMAIADAGSPLHGLREEDIDVQNGRLVSKADPARGDDYASLIKRAGVPAIEVRSRTMENEDAKKFSSHSFGAVFAEVLVDPDTSEIRLSRIGGAYGVGTILNAKTARSQLYGGVIFGIGMCLMEETKMDGRIGRVMNPDLAEYHVPVNADIPPIDIFFVDEHDPHVSSMGAKGIGEIGITGVVAAIANAVYHATGVRVRDLPVTLDKVLSGKMS